MGVWGNIKTLQPRSAGIVLASAYAVADGGRVELSPELQLLHEIDRFGVSAVMGRPLYHEEIVRMRAAERIISAYKAKYSREDWAKWAQDFPQEDWLLNQAMKLAGEYGWEHS